MTLADRSVPASLPTKAASFSFTVQADEYRNQPIPGFLGEAKMGDCYVRVTDLPQRLDQFMEVNPRVPKRTQKGILSGPVIKGILETLRSSPEDMALKNQGIYLLVDDAQFERAKGGAGKLTVTLADAARHGIVNGGHTYAAIRAAIEDAEEHEIDALGRAFVRLHVLQGIDESKVAEIAEGLNRSKQVDDPSLANLQGQFDRIRKVMKGQKGEDKIAYHQGDDGEVYISEILVMMQLFNMQRFSENNHPYRLYKQQQLGLRYFEQDLSATPSPMELLIPHLPEILRLADTLRKLTPKAAKEAGFEFGRMKAGNKRAGDQKFRDTALPFLGESMRHRVPNGWLFPMLAAFRANIRWELANSRSSFEWRVPLQTLVKDVISDLVRVCVTEHRDNNMKPELMGKRESAYRQCYDKVLLYLARNGKLN